MDGSRAEFAYNLAELKRLILVMRIDTQDYRQAVARSREAVEESRTLLNAYGEGASNIWTEENGSSRVSTGPAPPA